MTVVCIAFRVHVRDRLRGFANLVVRTDQLDVQINDCPVYEKTNGRFIDLPTRAYTTERGGRQFIPVIRFLKAGQFQEFQTSAAAALEAFGNRPAKA